MRNLVFATRSASRTKAVSVVIVSSVALLLAAGGWFGNSNGASPAIAQNPSPAGMTSGENLIVLALPQAQTPQGQTVSGLVVIDPVDRVLSVYQIDVPTGSVKLQSVRRIHWDLKMSDYNGQVPLPNEIRAMVEQH